MIKPLPTKNGKLPSVADLMSGIKALALPVSVAVVLTTTPPQVFGQGIAAEQQPSVRDNRLTGSALAAESSYSGEELRKLHPTDLLRALTLIDPSISGTDPQEQAGSDPNYVPETMDLQGAQNFAWQLSSVDALPLIIVDGHSESIERLKDFDMRRVSRVTILKNATATALYGVRAGHGAIVIETASPANERLRLTYNFDGASQKAALRSFDFMNGWRKLGWENFVGMYDGQDQLYQERMKTLRDNGSTDWVEMPVQTTFTHKHRVALEGGDSSLRYRGVLYGQPGGKGVMKGSDREMYGASAYVGYSTHNVHISNELSVDIVDASVSNYGYMYQWAQMNPYYIPADGLGRPYEELGEGTFSAQGSPLYEASLQSFKNNKITRVNNSFNLSWEIDRHFTVSGQFNLTRDLDKRSEYLSPMSLYYKDYTVDDNDQKGSFRIYRNRFASYQEQVWGSYRLSEGRHNLLATVGLEAYSSTLSGDGYTGVGMSNDHMNYVSFAQRYIRDGRPEGGEVYERMLSAYATVSWSLDNRLFVDLSGRVDKSSLLAPDHRTAGSYSLTAAYDLKKTALLENSAAVKALTLTAGYGTTAGYQFDYGFANPLYSYDIDNPYLNGMGSYDYSEGLVSFLRTNIYNPALKWKDNRNVNVGLRGSVSFLNVALQYYNTLTKNLLTMEPRDLSSGFGYNYANGGEIRNSGLEFLLSATLFKSQEGLNLSVFAKGVANKNKITKLPDYSAELFNEHSFEQRQYLGMACGNAADGLYALPSAGINAETGQEEYYLRDGSVSSTPTAADLVYMGSTTPKLRGTFGLTGAVRNVDFGVVFSYSLGGKYYNYYEQQLIDLAGAGVNVPLAALNKWTSLRTNAAYQGIEAPLDYASSRFVYTRNTFSISSLRVGYTFSERIARKLYMRGLKLNFTCDNLLYSSSVKAIHGYYYPYATSFILSLQATF